VTAVSGAALACCVEIDDWENPSPDAEVHRFVLDAGSPKVLAIPAGYANGAMSLLPDTKLLYFSDATLEASLEDDFRFPARHWDPWHVAER
jgi:dTDP-4-dehydrorhamnose 3,5-epimerase